jgi:hypothetical protein
MVALKAFTFSPDFWTILGGVFVGAIDVLPDESLVAECKDNVTLAPEIFSTMQENFAAKDPAEGMVQVSYALALVYNVTFNCYYSLFEITSKDSYSALLG